jgi:pSer/pThr/pTyr-binding forkhead associated (FHA) protein
MRLPFSINFKTRQLDLLEYDKPRQQYYILESVTAQNLKIIHVVTKHLVAVGRGLENEIRITDISVSRDHAILRWSRDGQIYV